MVHKESTKISNLEHGSKTLRSIHVYDRIGAHSLCCLNFACKLHQAAFSLASLQAAVRSGMHSNCFVLGLLFYSDSTEAKRKGHKFHPLSVYIANFTLDALRSQRGFRRIAHLPVLQEADFPHLTDQQ